MTRVNKCGSSARMCFFYGIPFLLVIATVSPSFAQPSFDLVGFATQNGGTTGGQGGPTVIVSSFDELRSYAESSSPHVIMVAGTISNGSGGGRVRIGSNTSIIGIGATALLKGVGLEIAGNKNVIIRNLKITLVGTSDPKNVNGGDCISIHGSSKNIWVDHCEIYSEDPGRQTDIDKYDGLIDIKGQTGFITLSWNHLHDHHKGGLVGASDSDLYGDRKITMHHNYYNKVRLRIPMYRGSVGHFFNNYIVGARDATEIRAGTCVRVEKNYYEELHYSIYTPSDAPGSAQRIDNIEISRSSRSYPSGCTADIPYDYSDVLTVNTQDVKTIVPRYAGVGKISERHSLTTSVAQGEGSIIPQSGEYQKDQGVQLEAKPAIGWAFDSWGGDLSGESNPTTLIMDADKAVSAFFIEDFRPYYTIETQAAPGGTITHSPVGTVLVEGSNVEFTAIANDGWTFQQWSGDYSGTSATHTISSLDSDIFLSAFFEPEDKYLYEAENGIVSDAIVENTNSGFSGVGYVNFDNKIGSSLDIPVYADEAGKENFIFTFANGSDASRPMSISVNGDQQIASIDFKATGDWTNWGDKHISLSLLQGANSLTFTSTGSDGGPNIDKIAMEHSTSVVIDGTKAVHRERSYFASKKVLCVSVPVGKDMEVSVFSLDGKKVLTRRISSVRKINNLKISLRHIRSGVYFIRYTSELSVKTNMLHILE